MKLPIPIEALEDRIAIVGRSGRGKTNAAKVMAEGLLELGARVCILDPTDAWWGLRLKPDGITPNHKEVDRPESAASRAELLARLAPAQELLHRDVSFFWKQHVVDRKKFPTPELDGRTWVQFPAA